MFRKETGSSDRKPYSVIGIYGIVGSGKSTLAQYVCDHENELRDNKEKATEKHFDLIMFSHVSLTFRVDKIFRDMLEQIKQSRPSNDKLEQMKQSRPSNDKDLKCLKQESEKELKDKCFLLVLDDLWVSGENQKEREILLDALYAGRSGSIILVTSQREDAARALGAQKQIKIPDLEEEQYLELFMHHALQRTVDDDGEFERVGSKIAERLHRSPIAAVTVAKQLQMNRSIDFWDTTAKLDVLNGTMGALWWSYQQLGVDLRRCFAYCSTFPIGYELNRDELVRIWIAQGLVNTSNAAEELEDVGLRYIQELLNFSFLQRFGTNKFIIHDLLHELAYKVAGSDFFRMDLNGVPKDIPPGVRHLFIETEDVAETIEKILDLENLRTLIIEHSADTDRKQSMEVEEINHDLEKTFDRLFMRLRKLRVLIIKLDRQIKLSLPTSIDEMKHLRYLGLHLPEPYGELILPRTIRKLYHMQTICVPIGIYVYYPDGVANLIHLRHITCWAVCPNIGRLTSLQTMEHLWVKKEQGYELRQLKHLNKLRGTLWIAGLDNVESKEALEADLVSKKGITKPTLLFDYGHQNRTKDPDMEAEVLEGLCPPKDLQELTIGYYKGSKYPSWILSCQHADAPKHPRRFVLSSCSQLESFPKDGGLFSCLRQLEIQFCDWDSLPDCNCHLTAADAFHPYLVLRSLELLCSSEF